MRKVLKWLGIGAGSLVLLALVAGGGIAMVGRSKLVKTHPLPAVAPLRTENPALLARGEHVATIHGCTGCHGEQLGGNKFLDIPPGVIIAPNLTRGRGGVGAGYRTPEDWDRAVRHGLRPSGQGLLPFMPWRTFSRLGDEDMAALVAYLRQVPPVDNELPATRLRPLGYIMLGMMDASPPAPPAAGRVTEPEPTAAYGAYLASHTCVECHGQDLHGGAGGGPPKGPSLTGAAHWTLEQFTRAVRQGVAPGERKLSDEMPFVHFAHLTDVEVEALYRHLQTLPPVEP